jgi:hypothetical protein
MSKSLRLILGLAALLAAAGCAGEGSGTADPAPAFGPDELVLQVAHIGGLRGMGGYADVPELSVYGDGRVITVGPQIAIYPAPALPNIQVAKIPPDTVATLWSLAETAGVGKKLDFGQPNVADATTTRIKLRTQAGLVVTDVYALRESTSTDGLTADQQANRAALRTLLTAVEGKVGGKAGSPYQATAVAGLAREWSADPNVTEPEVAWPGPALPGQRLSNTATGCVVATGEQAQSILAAAAHANAATPWTSGGKRWLVQIRPLLPDETDCASLV